MTGHEHGWAYNDDRTARGCDGCGLEEARVLNWFRGEYQWRIASGALIGSDR